MKAYKVWHPDSPGVSLIVVRPWWRRRSPWATTREVLAWHKMALARSWGEFADLR